MRRILSFLLAAAVIFCFAVPQAMAVCYSRCMKYDIWKKCYVEWEDRNRGAICADSSRDGICDDCQDRLFFVDEDQDGQCDNRSEVSCEEKRVCRQQAPANRHQGHGGHHGKGRKSN